jgi:hypothetical protein
VPTEHGQYRPAADDEVPSDIKEAALDFETQWNT